MEVLARHVVVEVHLDMVVTNLADDTSNRATVAEVCIISWAPTFTMSISTLFCINMFLSRSIM